MANNLIQIKRSAATATPASLNPGELAYSNTTQVLYIGSTDGASVVPIAGYRNPGVLTANQALVANSSSAINQVQVGNVVMVGATQTLSVNNSTGTAGYVLFSGGSGANAYWGSTGGLTTNVAAQYAWTNTQSFSNTISFNGQVNFANAISANGAVGASGYVLISGGTGSNVYWAAPSTLSINTAAQFTWTNTQTFSNTITFNAGILANTVNAVTYTAGVYGSATSGLVANSTEIAVGNATVNGVITANASVVYFTGTAYTANNATNLGGTAASAYQLNSTLGANIASYLPTYTGTVNAAVITDGSYGTTANGFVANSTAFAWGNSSANVVISWDSVGQDILAIGGNINNYIEAAIWNANTQSSASADFSINDSLGLYSNNYIDIGINGTGWSNSQWTINGPSDAYVYTGNTNLAVGTGGNQGNLVFFTAGTLAGNERMRITTNGNVGINNTNPTNTLSVNGTTYLGGTVAAGNTTVTGFVNATSSVNASSLTVGTNFIANTTGVYAGVVNGSTISVGTAFTANATLVNAAAINVVNQVNTATLYAATSANIASAVVANATGIYTSGLVNAASFNVGSTFVANASAVTITGAYAINGSTTDISVRNATFTGNVVVSGSVVTVNTATLQVNDNVIEVGFNNGALSTDAIDTGIYTPSNTAGTLQYSGLARIAASSATTLPWYKIFSTTTNPNSGLTITSSSTGILQAYLYPYGLGGAFVANSSVVNITANGTVSSTLTVNSVTLSTALAATSGGTGQSSYTTGDILYASSGTALSKLSVPGSAANGQVLQIVNNLPAYSTIDGGSF